MLKRYVQINKYVYGLKIYKKKYDYVMEIDYNNGNTDIYEIDNFPSNEYEYIIFTTKNKNYLCLKKIYTKDEIKKIEQFCTCSNCNSYFIKFYKLVNKNYITKILFYIPCGIIGVVYMIFGLLHCPCCVGCLSAGPEYATKQNIDKAYSLYLTSINH